MKVIFNSEEKDYTEGISVSELRKLENIPSGGVAVAVNGRIVRGADQESFILSEGDDVVIIGAAYGG